MYKIKYLFCLVNKHGEKSSITQVKQNDTCAEMSNQPHPYIINTCNVSIHMWLYMKVKQSNNGSVNDNIATR